MSAQASAVRFANFTHLKAIEYGSIRSQPLPLDILLPKSIESAAGPRPVLVHIHGGGLVGGARDFEPWWSVYILEWAARHNAVVVSPDYPLAPESQSPEIVGALKTFMGWMESSLQQTLDDRLASAAAGGLPKKRVAVDLSRLAMTGESAGAWCALHLGMAFPDRIRALVLRFAFLDLDDPYFVRELDVETFMGMPIQPASVYDEHVAAMAPGKIVTSAGMERMGLMSATFLRGNLVNAIGNTEESFPLKTIAKGDTKLPRKVWLFHGSDDSIVPIGGSDKTRRLIQEKVSGTEVKFDQRPGEHGFDTDWSLKDDPVLEERLAWIDGEWLR